MMDSRIDLVTVQLGNVFVTRYAAKLLNKDDVFTALGQHLTTDWGGLELQDWKANDEALEFGGRILSSYRDKDANKFWIITEGDRSSTTILLPQEY